jgi:lipid A 3-O-deacylase|uniref:Acyloxyacyl hydrolase n=1 Tax=Desulfobacca acetoxidans TaxID=60893 RepID=A0A7V6A4L9_9BACT
MRTTGFRGLLLAVLTVATFLPGTLGAVDFDLADCRHDMGLRLGYGFSMSGPSVHLYSLLPRWGIILINPHASALPGKLGISFELEGILSIAEAEDTGWELGITPLLKFTLPVTGFLHPFLEGGVGIITQQFNSPRVPHSFNFTPQVGVGCDLAVTSRWALTLAYRFRHSSNAGLVQPNPGLNMNLFQAGLTYFY